MDGQGRDPDVLFNMDVLQQSTLKPSCYPKGSRTCVGVFRLMLEGSVEWSPLIIFFVPSLNLLCTSALIHTIS